ncbi:MAG: hypothetical protein RLZZ403_1215 [Pseudomonadota bacterium]|jgi:hypothetical protein
MAIAFTFKSAQFSTTASTTYTGTTDWTPQANALQIAFVCGGSTASTVDPTTVTGHGLTWTKLSGLGANLVFGTAHTPSVWVSKTSASAGSSGSASANWATSRTGGVIVQFEITGIDLTVGSTSNVVEYVSSTGTGTFGTATLTGPTRTGNRPCAFYIHAANEATTPKSTWTEAAGADGNFANPATGAEVQYITSAYETGSSATWSTSSVWRSFALQILAPAETYTAPAASGGANVAGAGTYSFPVRTYTVASAGVKLAGAGAITRVPTVVTQDIKLGGAATSSKISVRTYTVLTQDVKLAGAGTYSPPILNKTYTVITQDIKVAGEASVVGTALTTRTAAYANGGAILPQAASANSYIDWAYEDGRAGCIPSLSALGIAGAASEHSYTASGGVLVAGAGTAAFVGIHQYTVVTQDIKAAGSATVAKTLVRSAVTQDIKAAGAGTYVLNKQFTYAAATQPVLAAGASTNSKTKAYSAVTQAIQVAGAATRAVVKLWLAAAAGVILAGSATTAQSQVHSYTPSGGAIVAGSATVAKTKSYAAATQDIKVDSAGTYSYSTQRTYTALTQDVKVAGSATYRERRWYQPDTMTVVTGTLQSGDVYSAWTEDANTITVQEVAGIPGFEVQFYYPLIPTTYPSLKFHLDGYYDGTLGHTVQVAESSNGSTWTTVGTLTGSGTAFTDYAWSITGTWSAIWVRLYHVTPGNPVNHYLYIDEAVLEPPGRYTAVAQDIKLAGTAGRAVEQVYAVITQDVLVDSAGTYSFSGAASHSYTGAGGAIVAGSVGVRIEKVYVVGVAEHAEATDTSSSLREFAVYRVGQGISSDAGAEICLVQAFLTRIGSPVGSVWMELWSSAADVPAALLASTGGLDAGTISASGGWATFAFKSGQTLTAATTYFLFVNGNWALDSVNFIQVATHDGNSYRTNVEPYLQYLDYGTDPEDFYSAAGTDVAFRAFSVRSDVLLTGSGSYSFSGTASHSYTGSGGVIVDSAGSWSKTKAYPSTSGVIVAGSATRSRTIAPAVATQDIKVDSGAAWSKTLVRSATTKDILVTGAATTAQSHQFTYSATGGVKVDSAGTWTKTLVRSATIADIRLDSAGAWTKTLVRSAVTQDVLVAGSATATKTKAYAASGGVIVAGQASRTLENVYAPVTQDILVAGSATTAQRHQFSYSVITKDVLVAGSAVRAIVYVYTPVTQDVLVAGSAAVAKVKAPTVTTADIRVTGSAGIAIEYVYAPIAQDIIVDSAGAYSFVPAASHTYTGSGGVIVAGSADHALVKTYTPSGGVIVAGAVSQTIEYVYVPSGGVIIAGTATTTKTKAYAATGGVIVAGSAGRAIEYLYAPITQDIIVSGAAAASVTKAYAASGGVIVGGTAGRAVEYLYAVVTQDVIVAGAGTYSHSNVHTYAAATQDIRVAGAASLAAEYVYVPITADILVTGTASLAVEKIASVIARDIIVDSQGAYQFVGAASNTYTGTGGVIVAGAAAATIEYVYAPIAADIIVSGSATRVLERVRYATTQDIIVSGAASRAQAFAYDVQTQDIKCAGTASLAVVKAPTVTTQDIIVSGSASKAVVYVYAAATQDVIVAGAATVSFEQLYAPVTADIIISGSAAVTKTKAPTVVTTDIKVDSAGTYQLIGGAAFVYYGSGGIIVSGTASQTVEYVYSPITSDIRVSGTATTAGIRAFTYTAVTPDIRVSGSAPTARTYAAQTQDVLVAGSAAWARATAGQVHAQDIHVAGAGTVAFEQAYEPIASDLKVGGHATAVIQKIAVVITRDVIVSGGGAYSFLLTGSHPYTGTGGVIVGGSYWPYGSVVRFCGGAFSIPQFTGVTFVLTAPSDAVIMVAGFDEIEFVGADACD